MQSANSGDDLQSQKATTQKLLDLPPTAWEEIEHETWECKDANMEPTLHVGDLYIVDLSETTPNDGVYLVDIGGRQKAMRLSVVPGKVIYTNDNSLYRESNFESMLSDLRIIGRVLRAGNKQPI
jgi:hypothetical protein